MKRLELESLEGKTPEFQRLTTAQQEERRKLLLLILDKVIGDPLSLGLTPEQGVRFSMDFLEFHLSGKIERFLQEEPETKRSQRKTGTHARSGS